MESIANRMNIESYKKKDCVDGKWKYELFQSS